eukprot:279925_1
MANTLHSTLQMTSILLQVTCICSQMLEQLAFITANDWIVTDGYDFHVTTHGGTTANGSKWNINVTTQSSFDFSISLFNSWGFHPYFPSTISFIINGFTSDETLQTDAKILFVFGISNEYFATSTPFNTSRTPFTMYPPNQHPLASVDSLHTIMSASQPERAIRFAQNYPWSIATNHTPFDEDTKWPMYIAITNNPIDKTVTYTWDDAMHPEIVTATYNTSFKTDMGFNLYMAGDIQNAQFTIYSFNVSNRILYPNTTPTSIPTLKPSNLPTNLSTIEPTNLPTIEPTKLPTNMPTISPKCEVYGNCASVSAHCHNELTVYYAVDDVSFTEVAYNNNGQEETRLFFEDINVDSVLRFSCKNTASDGGFIASVHHKNIIYSTTYPLSAGDFSVVASSDNILTPLVYKSKTSDPWNIDNENIGHNAYWIWNGGNGNTMTFEFNFDTIIAASSTLHPTSAPTNTLTKVPTTAAPSKSDNPTSFPPPTANTPSPAPTPFSTLSPNTNSSTLAPFSVVNTSTPTTPDVNTTYSMTTEFDKTFVLTHYSSSIESNTVFQSTNSFTSITCSFSFLIFYFVF